MPVIPESLTESGATSPDKLPEVLLRSRRVDMGLSNEVYVDRLRHLKGRAPSETSEPNQSRRASMFSEHSEPSSAMDQQHSLSGTSEDEMEGGSNGDAAEGHGPGMRRRRSIMSPNDRTSESGSIL